MPEADHDSFEERFAQALRDAGAGLDTGRRDLAAAGEARGRRLRTRRRAAVAGGVAGVALAGLAGTFVLPEGHDDAVHQRSAAATASTATRPAPSPVSAAELARTLEKLLPQGRSTQTEARGTDDHPYAATVYDDGRGKAAISVSVNRVPVGTQEARETTECPDKVFIAYDSCATTRRADGSVLMILKGFEYPNRRGGTKLWRAELVTPTGQHIGVQEWNAPAEKDAPVTRDEPPLTSTGLTALVTAPEWRAAADAIPRKQWPKPAPNEHPARTGSVSATLAGLTPHGIKVASKGSADPEFGYVVLDDGEGASLVQVNVQPDMRDVEDQLFGEGTETLPDGTKVTTHKEPGEKGVAGIVMWTVDTIRPDGRRVVVSAFNSGAQNTPPTRTAPALTMKQLRTIALDPTWLTLG
ncbi:hypothetical protein H1R13_26015 [Streptomyces mexicanus]|uniref:Uncharacterized protein n=1 Tax=Streptomyces mexicanus TaxID=178566 RepID=A0A7X1I3X5_9ACTN|nr:hypothetical protein [Streptomyces mexicanus]MBC2868292.1 hypothetical protein [Streptomyces mexicanus]